MQLGAFKDPVALFPGEVLVIVFVEVRCGDGLGGFRKRGGFHLCCGFRAGAECAQGEDRGDEGR